MAFGRAQGLRTDRFWTSELRKNECGDEHERSFFTLVHITSRGAGAFHQQNGAVIFRSAVEIGGVDKGAQNFGQWTRWVKRENLLNGGQAEFFILLVVNFDDAVGEHEEEVARLSND